MPREEPRRTRDTEIATPTARGQRAGSRGPSGPFSVRLRVRSRASESRPPPPSGAGGLGAAASGQGAVGAWARATTAGRERVLGVRDQPARSLAPQGLGCARHRLVWRRTLGSIFFRCAIFCISCVYTSRQRLKLQANAYLSAATKNETKISSCVIY